MLRKLWNEEFQKKFQQDTKHATELFNNPLWHDSVTFFVNKERDRVRNIITDNLTLPKSVRGLSEKGKGYKEGVTTAKKVLLLQIGENDNYEKTNNLLS